MAAQRAQVAQYEARVNSFYATSDAGVQMAELRKRDSELTQQRTCY